MAEDSDFDDDLDAAAFLHMNNCLLVALMIQRRRRRRRLRRARMQNASYEIRNRPATTQTERNPARVSREARTAHTDAVVSPPSNNEPRPIKLRSEASRVEDAPKTTTANDHSSMHHSLSVPNPPPSAPPPVTIHNSTKPPTSPLQKASIPPPTIQPSSPLNPTPSPSISNRPRKRLRRLED